MKLFYGHLFGFVMMTAVCFIIFVAVILVLPLIGAFITWDLAPLSFEWSTAFTWMRIIFVFSAFVGILFTTSKEGRELAKDFANG